MRAAPIAGKRPATYADIEALPENVVGEIVDDELFVSPRPRPRHARATVSIIADLMPPYGRGQGGPGGWEILVEPELHLGRQILVPDIAGWRRERLPTLPDDVGIMVAPDWICEVLSPSTARFDRTRKMSVYAQHDVGHLWLVDPVLRTLEVYRLDGRSWVVDGVHADRDKIHAAPFEAVELSLENWWTTTSGANEPPAEPYEP